MNRRTSFNTPTHFVRSASTQSLSPEPMKRDSLDPQPLVLSPLTVSMDEFSRMDVYNRANFIKSRAKDILNQKKFDDTYGFRRINLSLFQRILFHYRQAGKWKKKEWLTFFSSFFPISQWLIGYNWRNDLIYDIFGGILVSVMSVPQSLAYGMLVGVPPSYGLITGIIGPLVYSIFGSSRHASPGAFAIVSLMVGSTVETFSNIGDTETRFDDTEPTGICCREHRPPISEEYAIGISTSVTLLVGLFQILFGLMNAGLLSVWLSDHLVQGLTSGAAFHVLTSQIKSMTNISRVPPTSEPFQLVQFYICFFTQIDQANLACVTCSFICFSLLIISVYGIDPIIRKKIPIKFPMELLLVIGSTLIVKYCNIDIPTVGKVEAGIPAPKLPPLNNFFALIGPAISIAIISFVIHIALCKLISKKLNYCISSNQEWLALGLMHTTSSFFGCFAGGSSLGRTMMQFNIRTRTQLSTIVCALMITTFVLGAAQYIYHLPKAVLAVIVVFAMKDLFIQVYWCFTLPKKSFFDYMIFMITFTSVLLLNVNFGLVVGVSFALLTVVFRTQWADSTLLGRIKGTNYFRGLSHYGAAAEIPGIKVFRFDAPLYFANSEMFLSRIHNTSGLNPILVRGKIAEENKKNQEAEKKREMKTDTENLLPKQDERQLEIKGHSVRTVGDEKTAKREEFEITQLTHIIIDCSSIPYIDLMGKDSLMQVYIDYKSIEIEVLYANTKEIVRQLMDCTDFFEKVPLDRMFVSISDAVNQAKIEQLDKYIPMETSSRPIAKPANAPVAKSVAQKTAPLNMDFTGGLKTQSSQATSLRTGRDSSSNRNEGVIDTKQKRTLHRNQIKTKTKTKENMEDLDRTQ